jgi:HAD superfamily hydrolase (TIGR01484 family)
MTTLYVSDLDDTLLGADMRLSTRTRELINELVAGGLWFTVATARAVPPTRLVLDGLDLRLPVACMNGALVIDPVSGDIRRRVDLDPARAAELVDGLRAASLRPFLYTIDDGGEHHVHHRPLANPAERAYVDGRKALGDKRFREIESYRSGLREHVLSVAVIDEPGPVAAAYEAVRGDPGLTTHRFPDIRNPAYHWVEALDRRANKGSAALLLKELTGADRLVVFGDNVNDHAMFAVADESYAVANAVDSLRAIATGTIGAHHEDGVADFLNRPPRNSLVEPSTNGN